MKYFLAFLKLKKLKKFLLLVSFLVLSLAIYGCGDDSGGDSAPSLVGTWISCFNDGFGNDEYSSFTVTASDFSEVESTLTSTDAKCTGAIISGDTITGTYTTGPSITATLGADSVTAYELDVDIGSTGSDNFFTIYYIDTSVTPNVLYFGDETATPGLDGSSASTRPNVLQDWKPRVKQ